MPPEDTQSTGSGNWTKSGFRWANIIGSLVLVGLGLLILTGSREYAMQVGVQPGPGFFPVIIGGALTLLSGLWFGGSLLNRYPLDEEVERPPDRSALIRAVASFVAIGVAAFVMRPLGYPLTIALLVGLLTFMGGGKWRVAVITGPLFAATTFLLVTTTLGIQLPTGVLRPFLIDLL